MYSKSTTLDNLINYFESLGIDVNIGKNKARGNKGIFIFKQNNFRIDVAKNIENPISTMIHEFSHYVHSLYDKKLCSLDFIFNEIDDIIKEELIRVTVCDVPKDFASDLFSKKNEINLQIKTIAEQIKKEYPDFKISVPYKKIEKSFKNPEKYLLKYDRVRVWDKILSVESIEKASNLTSSQILYIMLKSKQRALRRINSRISKLNMYYNRPTEMFARFCEMYFTKPDKVRKLAPKTSNLMEEALFENKIPELSKLVEIMK